MKVFDRSTQGGDTRYRFRVDGVDQVCQKKLILSRARARNPRGNDNSRGLPEGREHLGDFPFRSSARIPSLGIRLLS